MQAQHQGNHLLGVQVDAALCPCLFKEGPAFADRLGRFLSRQSQLLASALQSLTQHQALVQPAGGRTGALLNSHAPLARRLCSMPQKCWQCEACLE